MRKRQIGTTDLMVPELGYGASQFGNLYHTVTDEEVSEALAAGWAAGIRYLDTSPFYGLGRSEMRLGAGMQGYPRDDFILSTKVGKLLVPAEPAAERYGFLDPLPNDFVYDYSYDGVMCSVESSLERLGLGRIDILLMHDIGRYTHGAENDRHFPIAMEGGYRAMDELRSAGTVKAIGLGVNEIEVCEQAMQHGHWDCFLLANRYTLLEQGGLHDFLPACQAAGTTIIMAGVYNSGILATGTRRGVKLHYDYGEPPESIIKRVQALEDVCDRHDVPLIAAALQFPLAHPVTSCVLPGLSSARRIAQTMENFEMKIPADFWSELKTEGLLEADCPVPE